MMSSDCWLSIGKSVKSPRNEDIVEAYFAQEEYDQHIAEAKTEALKALEVFLEKRNRLHKLEKTKESCKRVTEIYKGVAIIRTSQDSVQGNERYEFKPASIAWNLNNLEYPRYARIYRNQHNKTTWGLEFTKNRNAPGLDHQFQGNKYQDLDDCIKRALEWVACGNVSP